jgi:8-hydroxy-5-deazaflavin:NADPH oxidoreductase
MTTIGIIGTGKVGTVVARAAIANGYDVVLSNSREPGTLADLVSELGPQARAATVLGTASAADIVLIATPTGAIDTLPAGAFAGKPVIDANNYFTDRDGLISELESGMTTSSERLQKVLPSAHVVKTINHIYASDIASTASPAGTENRRALAVFGDDALAKAQVSAFIDAIGFDVVDAGPLSEGWRLEPGTPGWCVPKTATELRATLAATTP